MAVQQEDPLWGVCVSAWPFSGFSDLLTFCQSSKHTCDLYKARGCVWMCVCVDVVVCVRFVYLSMRPCPEAPAGPGCDPDSAHSQLGDSPANPGGPQEAATVAGIFIHGHDLKAHRQTGLGYHVEISRNFENF